MHTKAVFFFFTLFSCVVQSLLFATDDLGDQEQETVCLKCEEDYYQ